MPNRLLLAVLATSLAAIAQSPLTTTFANNNGGAVGGAVYFDLECVAPAGVTISSLDLNFDGDGGLAGSVDVYLTTDSHLPHTQDWAWVSSGAVGSTSRAGSPTNVALTPPVQLGLGCKVGVAIVANGLAHSYTTSDSPISTYATAELQMTVGGSSNVPFAGTLFTPRKVNARLHYAIGGGCPELASATEFGPGCVARFASSYEMLSPTAMDLSGQRIQGIPTAGGYQITTAPAAFVPVGSLGTVSDLMLGDDEVKPAGGTMGLEVSSNGQVFAGPGGSITPKPSIQGLLDAVPTTWAAWTDLNPNTVTGGHVFYEENAGGTVALITFDGVFGWGTTEPNSIQFRIDQGTGEWSITFGALSSTNPDNWLIGFSPSGANADSGAVDFTAGTIDIANDDTLPLKLTAVDRPVQGAVGMPFQVTTDNMPSGALSHMAMIGVSGPILPLAGFGMPDCFINTSVTLLDLVLAPPATVPSYTWTALTIPPGPPNLSGSEFFVQSVAFGTNENNFIDIGALTSNALRCRIGTL